MSWMADHAQDVASKIRRPATCSMCIAQLHKERNVVNIEIRTLALSCRLSAAVVDGKDMETVLFAADVAPVPGLDGVHEVRSWTF